MEETCCARILEVSLLRVGTVLHLERDAWSLVKRLRQAKHQHPPPPYPQNSPFNSRKSIQRRPPRLLWGSRSWLSLRLWCRPRSTPRRSPSSTSPPPPPSTAPGESPSPSCSYRRQTPVQPTAGFLALGLDRLRQVLPSTEGVDREYNLSCLGSLERI